MLSVSLFCPPCRRFLTGGASIAALFLAVPAFATPASPQTFSFSVTNTQGTVTGTFTGKIYGLFNNATTAATSVVIESFPATMNSLVAPPVDAMTFSNQQQNSFTVSNGQITGGGFYASQLVNGNYSGYQLYLNGTSSGFNFLNLDGDDTRTIYGNSGLANANFALVTSAAAPEPGSVALFLAGGVPAIGLLRARRKNHRRTVSASA